MNDTLRRYGSGAATGAIAFVLGYVLVYALTISVVQDSLLAGLAEAFGDENASWKIVGWLFFNAQFATTTLTVDVPLVGGTSAVNFITESDSLSPILYLIPPGLLTAAGLAAGRLSGDTNFGEAIRTGLSVVAGYLPLSLVGAFGFAISVGEGSGGSPTLLSAVVLAGIVYPAVFGTGGAVLAMVLGRE